MKIEIVADKGREEAVCAYLRNGDITLIEKQITVGDFCILCDDIIRVIFERKTLEDLAATIRSPQRKANHQKLLNLRKECNCVIVYLIEGPANPRPDRKFGHIPYKSLAAYLDHIILRDLCHVVNCDNQLTTANTIIRMANSLATIKSQTVTNNVNNIKQDVTNDDNADDDTNDNTNDIKDNAKDGNTNDTKDDVLVHGGSHIDLLSVRTPIDVSVMSQAMWFAISGITAVSYPGVREIVSLQDLLTNDVDILINIIKEVKYTSSHNRLGIQRARQIVMASRTLKTQTKMLATIRGVTSETAQKILAVYKLRDLKTKSEVEIANIVKKRTISQSVVKEIKVGNTIAKRIIEVLAVS